MRVLISQGQHHPAAASFFNQNALDAFLRADTLAALFADKWRSVLVSEGDQAMLHAFVPNPIGATGYFDIEPWLGYAGPIFNTHQPEFVAQALRAYSGMCREARVVAELIRFDPMRRNHLPLANLPEIEIFQGRAIAYVPILKEDDEAQLRLYTPACRRRVLTGRRHLFFRKLGNTVEALKQFLVLYYQSLDRVRAARRWYFDAQTFERVRRTSSCSLWGVFADEQRDDELVSAMLVVAAGEIACSLLIANGDLQKHKGGGELLTHEVVRTFAEAGYRCLCLGGGRSSAEDDSLLAFKGKFCSGNLIPLPLGFIVHDAEAAQALCAQAARERPLKKMMQPSTEIMQRFMGYRLAPSFANPEALS